MAKRLSLRKEGRYWVLRFPYAGIIAIEWYANWECAAQDLAEIIEAGHPNTMKAV